MNTTCSDYKVCFRRILMTYKIIGDSCMDLIEKDKKDEHIQLIPLTLQVDDKHFIDDETFSQAEFLRAVAASPNCPKSACPSPNTFLEAYKATDASMIFVITLSQHLSGSYNSAEVARQMYEEESNCDGKQIAVISSDSASVGESLIGFEIRRMAEAGETFEAIMQHVNAFVKSMQTYFVLESLEALRKNGRLTGIQAFFATALNIKPVMAADSGRIIKKDQVRGINRALARMVDLFVKEVKDSEDRVLGIAHCNCPQRAAFVKELLLQKGKFKDVYITNTAGVATLYASDGGIIVCC